MDRYKKFEVRCHEWGDNGDYHIEFFPTKEAAQTYIDHRNQSRPSDMLYEHWYIVDLQKHPIS